MAEEESVRSDQRPLDRITNAFVEQAALHPTAKWHLRQAAKVKARKKGDGWSQADWAAIRREIRKIATPR